MSCPEYEATIRDNMRLLELLIEVRETDVLLPRWLQDAIDAEIEEANSYRQSAIDQAYWRGREDARQLPLAQGEAP